jgi:hypothetical protein
VKALSTTILTIGILGLLAGPAGAEKIQTKSAGTARGLLDCTGLIEVECGQTYPGDNIGAPNNVQTYSCSGWTETGGEVVYHLFLSVDSILTVTLSGHDCDLDVFGLAECDESSCLVFDDNDFTYGPHQGDFYVVVDGYSGAGCAFEITFECTPYEPQNVCDLVQGPDGCGLPLTGNTCDSENYIDNDPDGCNTYTEQGREHWYSITLAPEAGITASVISTEADGALWVLDRCVEPFGCLAFSDENLTGQPEIIQYVNNGTEPNEVFLVIDSWGTDSCGFYEGFLDCTGSVIDVERVTWGKAKQIYR